MPGELDWRQQAACAIEGVDPNTFFDVDADEFGGGEIASRRAAKINAERRLRAKLVCSSCPVWRECLEAGLDEPYGIWGGFTVKQREYYRRSAERERWLSPRRAKVSATFVQDADWIVRDFRDGYSLAELAAWYEVPVQDVTLAIRAASSF